MEKFSPFTVYRSPLTVRYPFTVIHDQWLMAALHNLGEGGVNGRAEELL